MTKNLQCRDLNVKKLLINACGEETKKKTKTGTTASTGGFGQVPEAHPPDLKPRISRSILVGGLFCIIIPSFKLIPELQLLPTEIRAILKMWCCVVGCWTQLPPQRCPSRLGQIRISKQLAHCDQSLTARIPFLFASDLLRQSCGRVVTKPWHKDKATKRSFLGPVTQLSLVLLIFLILKLDVFLVDGRERVEKDRACYLFFCHVDESVWLVTSGRRADWFNQLMHYRLLLRTGSFQSFTQNDTLGDSD